MRDSIHTNRPVNLDDHIEEQIHGEFDHEIAVRLNQLIQLNLDAQVGYETAATHVANEDYRHLMREYAGRREQFAGELSRLVRNEGEEARESGSLEGLVRQAWINLKAALTNGDGAILEECRNADGIALRAYQDAIGEITVEPLLVILRRQFTDVRNAYERMKALSAALNR
jgi:uncharacterized protein (TIGR02284 family)